MHNQMKAKISLKKNKIIAGRKRKKNQSSASLIGQV